MAVTSGLTETALPLAAVDGGMPARVYEAFKRQYLQTEAQCAAQGIGFVPFVVEAEGGFGTSALAVMSQFADDAGRLGYADRDGRAAQLKERVAVVLQQQNAAALLARAPRARAYPTPAASDAAAWAAAACPPLRGSAQAA